VLAPITTTCDYINNEVSQLIRSKQFDAKQNEAIRHVILVPED